VVTAVRKEEAQAVVTAGVVVLVFTLVVGKWALQVAAFLVKVMPPVRQQHKTIQAPGVVRVGRELREEGAVLVTVVLEHQAP
jgi:hypothetical protein